MKHEMTFEQAKDWYQNLATNMEIAGVKTRLYKCYPDIVEPEAAFVRAVQDERARKPLP